MSRVEALMVRIYLSESDHTLKALLACLHDELRVRGVTVMRGIEGYGASGKRHGASLIDLSLDLPLVVEFFDRPERAASAITRVERFVRPGHIVSWPISVEFEESEC
jgi:PII-like signaling protein